MSAATYYERNKEKIRQKNRERYWKNRASALAQKKQYYEKNKADILINTNARTEAMTDGYIRKLVAKRNNVSPDCITDAMIRVARVQLKIKRDFFYGRPE